MNINPSISPAEAAATALLNSGNVGEPLKYARAVIACTSEMETELVAFVLFR